MSFSENWRQIRVLNILCNLGKSYFGNKKKAKKNGKIISQIFGKFWQKGETEFEFFFSKLASNLNFNFQNKS